MLDLTIRELTKTEFDFPAIAKQLHIRPGSTDESELGRMLEEAQRLAHPRYLFMPAQVTERTADSVWIDGIRFDSRVLSTNLENSPRVFPYLCTCGMELEIWGRQFTDWVVGYWVEIIKQAALRQAILAMHETVHELYSPGHISSMSPGSLENWPISQQKPLFHLLGNPAEVELSDSMLMVPTKSVSGILFSRDESFESCQLCPRRNCPNRRAPYDETLYEKEYCPAA